ncbi:hypothetical protein FGO68_gene2474 [Halteria grandinella]|uniref:Mitochondrial carrier protein n=1 Tax=Halteria grandinella TaxID=5974 RepID=A0A8J8T0X9_HALGN|nr:hypothetical protein FGO68_gene2474 [Halteria grandinella]
MEKVANNTEPKTSAVATKLSFSQSRQQQLNAQKVFAHGLATVLLTKAIIFGPLERMKIVLQVNPLANYTNPSDRPKGALDLSNKISVNQGLLSFYRGNNAYLYKLAIQHILKFMLYETVFQQFNHKNKNDLNLTGTIAAASATAIVTTAITYPLDLAHGRMAADMSKKTIVVAMSKNASPVNNRPPRLYSSVRDCLTKTQEQSGVVQSRKFMNMFRGIQSALIAQVPYTVVLMTSFELFNTFLDSPSATFNKRDDHFFLYKYLTRFGASTFSLLLAQALCYPLDTVKRRMQVNGSLGFKNMYKSDLHCLQTIIAKEGVRQLYSGWSLNMVKCVPLTLMQYIMFQNLRFISKEQRAKKE